jgi:hypothetical protein
VAPDRASASHSERGLVHRSLMRQDTGLSLQKWQGQPLGPAHRLCYWVPRALTQDLIMFLHNVDVTVCPWKVQEKEGQTPSSWSGSSSFLSLHKCHCRGRSHWRSKVPQPQLSFLLPHFHVCTSQFLTFLSACSLEVRCPVFLSSTAKGR